MSCKRWRRLAIREDGTIALFAVVVLSSLLLFFGTLIDYARIMTTGLMSEDATRSGVRSVMSAYDYWLYERYGLFGRGGTDGGAIFNEVVEGNLGESTGTAGFGIVGTTVIDARLNTSNVLGEHEVFARQVLEEMKYKAPIDMTLEVAAKLIPLADSLKQSGQAIDSLSQLRKLYERREALLMEVLLLQEQAAELVATDESLPLVPAGTEALRVGADSGTLLSLLVRFEEYAEQQELDKDAQKPKYEEQTSAYEDEVSSLTGQLRAASTRLERKHAEKLSAAKSKLEQAEAVNEEMNRVASRSQASSGYDGVQGKKIAGTESFPLENIEGTELNEVRKSGEQLLRASAWWTTYRNELLEQGVGGTGIVSEIEQLLSRLTQAMAVPYSVSNTQPLSLGVSEIQLAVQHYETQYSGQSSLLTKRRTELANADFNKQLREQEARTETAWQDAGKLLNGLASMRDLPEHRELFQEVEERYEENRLFNQMSGIEEGSGDALQQAKDADEGARQASDRMEGLFAGMSEMLEGSRNMFYYGEYAAARFSHFAPQQLLDLIEYGDVEGVADAASFHNQEMEYWLYGFHDPMGNLIAAYGELFGARLAIRTMEGLIASRSLGHPLLILSAALLYGVEKATEDMLSFARKGTAPLSKYSKVELSYLDYLRLFALLHGGKEEARLARMIAVIEQNSDLVLSQVPTGVTGDVTFSVKLWFLPAATKLIGKFGMLKGRVSNGRYEAVETAGWSY
ncbi:TadE/TadG family type IV pilus assembly protein [Paenibacillus sp. strain BS8-2]